MNKQTVILSLATASLIATSCAQHQYSVADVQRTRIVIDQRYDANPDSDATAFLAPYKQKVDDIMSPVMGVAACDMPRFRPESPLSNPMFREELLPGQKTSRRHGLPAVQECAEEDSDLRQQNLLILVK